MFRIKAVFVLCVGMVLGIQPMRAEEENLAAGSQDRPVVESLPTLWIVGDGMVACEDPARGWGQELHAFFDLQKMNVVNKAHAVTQRKYMEAGRLKEIELSMKPGDFMIVSFCQNYQRPMDTRMSRQPEPPLVGIRPAEIKRKTPGREDLATEKKLAEEKHLAEQIQSQGELLRKIVQAARLKQVKVILCTPVPRMYPVARSHNPFGRSFVTFVPVSPLWRAMVEDCAKSERTAFVDLSDIVSHAYKQLTLEKVRSFNAPTENFTNGEGALFNARLVVSGLRSIPTGPLEGFLNDAGREMPLLFGNQFRYTFTLDEGKTIDGVLVSAEGDSAEIMEFPTRRKVTVKTPGMTEADRKFIEDWKKENPTIRLTHQVTRAVENQQHYYALDVKNASKDPTPKLMLHYHYKIDVKGDRVLGGYVPGKDFGSIEIPTIPAFGSVTVYTPRISLEDRKEMANTNQILKWKEVLSGIAFDIYFGERLVDKYRANGFRENVTLLRDSAGYRLDKP